MTLELYFGVRPLSFFRADSSNITFGKDHIRRIVKTYKKSKTLYPEGRSRAELKEMVCHDGKWYANKDELERALE
jgi:hypothetical protein